MDECFHVYFKGIVQGVGFRYTARYLADRYNIKGWVMNLSDGRVELRAEGEPSDVDSFLKALQEEFKNYISDFQLEELPAPGKYKDFQIRFF